MSPRRDRKLETTTREKSPQKKAFLVASSQLRVSEAWVVACAVELFDAHDVSFVSVTQQFNTTTSMGRLTLNVLLTFAQFEGEVTSERICDKIAALQAQPRSCRGPRVQAASMAKQGTLSSGRRARAGGVRPPDGRRIYRWRRPIDWIASELTHLAMNINLLR
jgi:Resolvase, N terminal domain